MKSYPIGITLRVFSGYNIEGTSPSSLIEKEYPMFTVAYIVNKNEAFLDLKSINDLDYLIPWCDPEGVLEIPKDLLNSKLFKLISD